MSIIGASGQLTPRLRAADIPSAIARDRDVPRAERCFLVQLTRDWNNRPTERDWLLSGEPTLGCNTYDLAKVAAVVRGLCERDGHSVPGWIEGVQAPTDILLLLDAPTDSPLGVDIRSRAPTACAEHGVYYEPEFLEPKEALIAQAARAMGRTPRTSLKHKHVMR